MNISDVLTKQKNMRKVIVALLPIIAFSYYLFGYRVFILLIITNIAAVAVEYIMTWSIDKNKVKVTESVFVSATLFTLTLPPATPYWVACVGIIFGILFGKMVFGGFGKNIFNPALVGRCFIYISFPAFMTNDWIMPFSGLPGGLTRYLNTADAVTSATPIVTGGFDNLKLFLGLIPGSLGETSALLIILGGVYLVLTKTASWKIMLSMLAGFLFVSLPVYIFGQGYDPLYSLLSGGLLFTAIFMATDPVSAPKQEASKIIYGFMAGSLTMVIRSYSVFTEGAMFAVLIANIFVSLIDMKVKAYNAREKVSG